MILLFFMQTIRFARALPLKNENTRGNERRKWQFYDPLFIMRRTSFRIVISLRFIREFMKCEIIKMRVK